MVIKKDMKQRPTIKLAHETRGANNPPDDMIIQPRFSPANIGMDP